MEKKLEGKKCPNFNGECTSNKNLSNKDFIGKNLGTFFLLNFFPYFPQIIFT